MNTNEGLARIAKVAHWSGIAGAAFFVVEFAREFVARYPDDERMATSLALAAACYAAGRAAAWVTRGFSAPK